MTATGLAIVGHLGQVIAIVAVVLIGDIDVGELEASPTTTVAQPSKPPISGIGLLKLRWVVLNDSGHIERQWRFRSGNSAVKRLSKALSVHRCDGCRAQFG